jgi:tetratricopeptide (TPR) repeat protein
MVLLLATAGAVHLRALAGAHLRMTRAYSPRSFVPSPDTLEPLSLGYQAALADLLWMRALVYFGEELEHNERAAAVFDHAEAILALDPDFKAAYTWIGVAGTYRTGEVKREDYLRTLSFLRRAAERFPDDAEIRWDVGATMVYDQPRALRKGNPELSRRIELEGLEHVEYAATHGAAPPWVLFTAATKRRELGQTEQALNRLREMAPLIDDPEIRQGLEQRIAALQAESAGLQRDAELEHLERRHRATYPWVPLGLWILVDDPAADDGGLMRDSGDGMLPAPDETDARTEEAGADPRGDGDRRLRGR